MKLKLLVSLVGPEYSLAPGDEHEFPDEAEAVRHIEAGHAVPVSKPNIERAVSKPREKRG